MKKTLVFLVVILSLTCKNEKKGDTKADTIETKKELVITTINIPDFTTWGKIRINLEEKVINGGAENTFLLSRATVTESSFAHSRDIAVNYESSYRASIIVKKSESNSFFGLRVVGSYPDRVDAIFDLETGSVKEVKKERDFKNPKATIESIGNGWYKCSVMAEPYADKIKIMFGPTIEGKPVLIWEGTIDKQSEVYIMPSSLTLEEITERY